MATKVGVWIDHARAIVVLITEQGEEIKRLESDIKKPARTATGARVKNSYTPNDFVAEDHLERKVTDHLNKYYDEIIASIRGAEAILILGPGEAKNEFKKRVKSKKLRGRVEDLETADKMTDRKVAELVRQHFSVVAENANSKKANKTKPAKKRSKTSR